MPSQNHDDIVRSSGESRARHLLERVQRRSSKLLDPNNERLSNLLHTAQSQLSPHLEALAEWLLDTQRIEQLQGALSHVANAAISVGFHIDPAAALLFDFMSWLEEEHGKQQVFPRVLQHAALDDPAFMRLLTRSITTSASRGGVDASPTTHDPDVLRVRAHLLHMLCALTQLEEEDAPLPAHDDIPALIAYLERAILPERFDLLPGLAAGRQEAFDELLSRRHKARKEQDSTASITEKVKLAMLDRLLPAPPQDDPSQQAQGSTSLSRSVRSPALSLLTSGYLLFLHTTLTRAALESFPDIIEGLKQAEHDAASQQQREDAIDISPPE